LPIANDPAPSLSCETASVQRPAAAQFRVALVVPGVERLARGDKPKAAKKPRAFKDGSRTAALARQKTLLAAAAGLPEPFCCGDLERVAGCKMTLIYQTLWRWKNKTKWIVQVGRDQYRRTKKFPQAEGEPAAGNGSVSERLKAARADLAAAVAHHEPTRARVAADLVAELERA